MADVIIIHGYAIVDGKLPDEQKARIDRGIKLLRQKKAPFLLVSGGRGQHFNTTSLSLAEHMKRYAVKKGVNPRQVLLQKWSFNTLEDLLFAKKIVDKNGWKSLILVSSDYHIPRIKMICKYVFLGYKLSFSGVRVKSPTSALEKAKIVRDKEFLEKWKLGKKRLFSLRRNRFG